VPAPRLIVVCGLPATGKTTVASALAQERGAAFVRIDTIEHAIVEWSPLEQPLGAVGYAVGYALAADQLTLGLDVVVECVNPLMVTRDAWARVATQACAQLLEVELVCSDPREHRRRAESRTVDIPRLVLPTWRQITEREYEPWSRPHLVIDTATRTADDCVALISRQLAPCA
jgi:predicted kinase